MSESPAFVSAAITEPVFETVPKQSIWSRLRAMWWIRGPIGAVALVSALDQAGFGHGWLRVFHAIGARWHEWMGNLGAWIGAVAPFPVDLRANELTYCTIVSVIVIPALVPWTLDMRDISSPRGMKFMSPRMRQRVADLALASLLLMLGSFLAIGLAFLWPGDSAHPAAPTLDPTSNLPEGAQGIGRVVMFAGFALMMAVSNRRYFKILVVAATFIATLEFFLFVPVIDAWIESFANWLDPQPAPAT